MVSHIIEAVSANVIGVSRCKGVLPALNKQSLWKAWPNSWGNDFGLVKKGLLMLCKSGQALEEEKHAAEHARALGVPAEILSPEEAAKLDPGVRMDIAGAVYFPKDCHLSPNRFMAGLTRLLEKEGAAFRWSTEITGFRKEGDRIVSVCFPGGELAADEFVVAGGSWSPILARALGLNLPMQAGKGYSLTLAQPRRLPQLCSILNEARVAVTPMGSSLRFGGTMEIAGLDESINPVRVQGIVKSSVAYFPEFKAEDFSGTQAWRGLRPCSPDGLPYLGRPRRYRNVCLATGHAMMGLSLGPVTGKLMAQVLSDEAPSIDLELARADRYG